MSHKLEEWTEWTDDEDGGEEFNNEFHDVDTDNTDSEWISGANVDSGMDRESCDYQILHKTIFAEARGESELGQRAVAWVIKNRADQNRDYWGGDTIAGVCLQPGQFECWNPDRSYLIDVGIDSEPDAFSGIDAWLPEVYLSPDPTGGADFYNNPDIEGYPPWTENVNRVIKIDNHQFYKSRG
uniref:Cell wall hydrolase SleB domain-containing protein n=1 Tax=Daphnia galeata TaxID=27404 RepID=A0A8J2WL72_9CRUS|nr:unnamed protein product [Daphnia galeata]